MSALTYRRLTVPRLFGIALIYAVTTVAWFTLGGTIVSRTGESDSRLQSEVSRLWGGRHTQVAPTAAIERPTPVVEEIEEKDAEGRTLRRKVQKTELVPAPVPLTSSRVDVSLALDQRRKGLLWFDTYGVALNAEYRFRNPDDQPRTAVVHFSFPSSEAIYDGFLFEVAGRPFEGATDMQHGLDARTLVAPGAEVTIRVAYRSRGLDEWSYAFVKDGVAQVRDFTLNARTDFRAIDFPAGTISPTRKLAEGAGWQLVWRFESLAAGQRIGVDAPNRINPGPFAARVTFFAPVGLLFFLTVMVLLGVLRHENLHPMSYFFLAAAFFAFHLLLAYLVDQVDVHLAFAIAAATSLVLVVSYLRAVAGMRVALVRAGSAQVVFLILFSYAFFFEGLTGLAVTIGAVLTLFVLMQMTARVDWERVFARDETATPTSPAR